MAGILGQGQDINGILGSPQMRGIAQALLAASGPSTQPIGMGQALGQGLALGDKYQQQDYERQLQQLMLGLKMKELERKDQITPYQNEYLKILQQNADARSNPPAKPLPATAMKLQNETLEELKIANNIQADMGNVIKSIETGQLKLGLGQNAISSMKNYLGKSDDVSRNYGTFKTSLEKMRNDSLRLNKGVQTEGDAVRAWNELFENLNDEQYVLQRLKEIQKTNARAADLKKLQVDQIRGNFNADPLDYSQYDSSPAILDQPAKNAGGNVISYEDYFK